MRYEVNEDGTWSLHMESKALGPLEINSYLKRTMLERGYAYLGAEYEEVVPEIELRMEDGWRGTVRGYTKDPEVLAAVKKFIAAVDDGTAHPGEVT